VELTRHRVGGDILGSLFMNLLGLFLACIAKDLHDTRSVLTNLLKQRKALGNLVWRSTRHGDAHDYAIFNTLTTALALVCVFIFQSVYGASR